VYAPAAVARVEEVQHAGVRPRVVDHDENPTVIRGLHSSSSQLKVCAFCGIRNEIRGCLGGL
jgi:hypothetical protein